MVERREDGEPIPDGKIIVEITKALAEYWDGSDEPRQSETFRFKDIKFLRQDVYGLSIFFPDWGERANTRITIPWHSILCIEVTGNSDEYVKLSREFNNNKPTDLFDTRHGGTCVGCQSRG